jgi:hypothetical protein
MSFSQQKAVVSITDLITYLASKYVSLTIGSITVVALAIGAVSFMPKYYESVSAVSLSEGTVRNVDAAMSTPFILDQIVSAFPTLRRETPEASRRKLREAISWSVAAGDNRRTATLFFFSVVDQDPAVAQGINRAYFDAWLTFTKPRPEARIRLEEQISRMDVQIKDATALITQLESEAPRIVSPNSLQGELASSLSMLRVRRDGLTDSVIKLRQELLGFSRDVVVSPATLPIEHIWPNRRIITLMALAGFLSLWLAFYVAKFQFMNRTR